MNARSLAAPAVPTAATQATPAVEREADRMADAALARPGLALNASAAAPRPLGSGRASASPAWQPDEHTGSRLEEPVRHDMEARLGHDFSAVRIHTGSRAVAAARQLQAAAYAIGSHVIFGRDNFAPQGAAGQRLLAHELAHVVQQGTGRAPVSPACAPDLDYMSAEERIDEANKALDSLADKASKQKGKLEATDAIAAMDAIRLARRAATRRGEAGQIAKADALVGRYDVVTHGTAAGRPSVFEPVASTSSEPPRHDAEKNEAHIVLTAQRGFDNSVSAGDVTDLAQRIKDLQEEIDEARPKATTDRERKTLDERQKKVDRMRSRLSTATPTLKHLPTLEASKKELEARLAALPKNAPARSRQSLQTKIDRLNMQMTAVNAFADDPNRVGALAALQGGGKLGVSGVTYVTVYVLDANNKLLTTLQARNEGRGGDHAEDVIVAQLKNFAQKTPLAGATLLVDGDQEVCNKCDPMLKEFSKTYKLKGVINRINVTPTMDRSGQLTGDLSKAKTLAGKISNPDDIDKLERAGATNTVVPRSNQIASDDGDGGDGGRIVGPTGTTGGGGAKGTVAGRGNDVAPIVQHGPSPTRTAAADGIAQLVEWGSGKLTQWANENQQELANEKLAARIAAVKAMWDVHPEQGVLFTILWTERQGLRTFVDIVARYGVDAQQARNDGRAVLTKAGSDIPHENTYDEIWIAPPQPLSIDVRPTPFPRIALATFAKQNEVQDVTWGGVSTFDDDGFTSLKPTEGVKPKFYVLQPPDEIEFMNGRMLQKTSVPILHRSAPGGWTVPVVNLDTVVGNIPGVDRDTAAMVFPADEDTRRLFMDSPALTTDQLRRYQFENIRFVSPNNIQVLESLSESAMPPPKNLAKMTPKAWAEMSLVVHGEPAQKLVSRMSRQGGVKVSPEFFQEFLSILPMDLTDDEVDQLSGFGSNQGPAMSEGELLEAWRAAIERIRGGGSADAAEGTSALTSGPTDSMFDAAGERDLAAESDYVSGRLRAVPWTGLTDGYYFTREDGKGGPAGSPLGTSVRCLMYGLHGKRKTGLIVTARVDTRYGDATQITVTHVHSHWYQSTGEALSDGRELMREYRILPLDKLKAKRSRKATATSKTP